MLPLAQLDFYYWNRTNHVTLSASTLLRKYAFPIATIAALLAIVMVIAMIKLSQFSAAASSGFAPPPAFVNVFQAEQQKWYRTLKSIGTIYAEEGITILAETEGPVDRIAFKSGDFIRAGDLVIEQYSGSEAAQLNAANAQLRLAESNFKRLKKLRKQKTVSASQFEQAQQELDSARANVENLETLLVKKQIRAPFDGKLGIRKVDLGEYLRVGSPIVTLQAHDKLNVNFAVPQRWLALVSPGLNVEVNMLETKNAVVHGAINAVDAAVDTVTRNIEVQARLNDSQGLLLPGMAVEVRVEVPEFAEHIVVPATAIVYSSYGDTVFVVEENSETGQLHARQQLVQIAERRGDFVAIETGVKLGELVASSGAFKLYNGQAVAKAESPETEYNLNPEPNDT